MAPATRIASPMSERAPRSVRVADRNRPPSDPRSPRREPDNLNSSVLLKQQVRCNAFQILNGRLEMSTAESLLSAPSKPNSGHAKSRRPTVDQVLPPARLTNQPPGGACMMRQHDRKTPLSLVDRLAHARIRHIKAWWLGAHPMPRAGCSVRANAGDVIAGKTGDIRRAPWLPCATVARALISPVAAVEYGLRHRHRVDHMVPVRRRGPMAGRHRRATHPQQRLIACSRFVDKAVARGLQFQPTRGVSDGASGKLTYSYNNTIQGRIAVRFDQPAL